MTQETRQLLIDKAHEILDAGCACDLLYNDTCRLHYLVKDLVDIINKSDID